MRAVSVAIFAAVLGTASSALAQDTSAPVASPSAPGVPMMPTPQTVPAQPAPPPPAQFQRPNVQSGANGAQKPPPRDLTPAELDELRRRMVGSAAQTILRPDDVETVKKRVIEAQGAQGFPGLVDKPMTPRPKQLFYTKVDAVGAPKTVHLALGAITPITFVDAKGKPWPIAGVSYDPRSFAQDGAGCGAGASAPSAGPVGERPGTISLMPCRYQAWGNIIIQLEAIPYPIVLMLQSGGDNGFVDIPVTVRLHGVSPLAAVAAAVAQPASARPPRVERVRAASPARTGADGLLLAFADGTPPKGAVKLRTSDGGRISAWAYNGQLFVRGTDCSLLNPQYDGTAESPNGTRVWRVSRLASRVLVADRDGTEFGVTIEY